MEYLTYFILGLIQGITEPLPISSSGHLLMTRLVFDIGEMDVFFEIMMHFASLFAVLIIFKDKLIALFNGALKTIKKEADPTGSLSYIGLVLLGSIPVGIVGIFIRSPLESLLENYGLIVIGVSLWVTGLFLWAVKPLTLTNQGTKVTVKDALLIGLAQVIAILPGISRSGATFVGGLFRRLNVATIIEFSFMLYIPVTLGVSLLELLSLDTLSVPIGPLALAFIASFTMTYFSLKWFRRLAIAGHLKGFALYCFSAGTFALVFFFF